MTMGHLRTFVYQWTSIHSNRQARKLSCFIYQKLENSLLKFCLVRFLGSDSRGCTSEESCGDSSPGSTSQVTHKRKLGSIQVAHSAINIDGKDVGASAGRAASKAKKTSSGNNNNNNKEFVKEKEHFIKLSDSDVRTKFAGIFCEAFNNFDKVEFSKILQQHCEPDLLVIYEYVGAVNPYGPKYIEIKGLDTAVVFWDSMLTAIPDSRFDIHGANKYKVLPNAFISIVSTFTFVGTQVYTVNGMHNNKDKSVVLSTSSSNNAADSPSATAAAGANSTGVITTTLPSDNNVTEQKKSKTKTSKSTTAAAAASKASLTNSDHATTEFHIERAAMTTIHVTVIGTLTYYVNPDKKIYRISFVHSVKP